MNTHHLSQKKIASFQQQVYHFFSQNQRKLPWRDTADPYHILLSEFMLQQTQVSRVIPKYQRWLTIFPNVKSLSQATFPQVMLEWQGLGYNRRAKFLHQASRIIQIKHEGKIPSDKKVLKTLPGIGEYTASAIRVFAFNKPDILIETNIRSVYIHNFFPKKSNISDQELLPLIEATYDTSNPRRWGSALMDYGAWIKTQSQNPSRRSKHYTIQSTFEGSTRQLRGHIVRELLQKPMSKAEIIKAYKDKKAELQNVLDTLVQEKFIHEIDGTYHIKTDASRAK